jgi:hypothetical protein
MFAFANKDENVRWDARGHPNQRPGIRRGMGEGHSSAFTLIEVVLAVAIAAGMLLVVLMFYQQVAALRGRLIERTAGISAIRLLLERLSCELGAVRRSDVYQLGVSGGSDNLQLLKLEFPRPGAWTNPATAAPFRWVSYSLQGGAGLVRSETPMWASAVTITTNEAASAAPASTAMTNDLTLAAETSAFAVASPKSGMSAMPTRASGAPGGSRGGKGASTARAPKGTATASAASPARAAGANSSPKAMASPKASAQPDDTLEPILTTDAMVTTSTTNRTNVVAARATRGGGLAIGQAQFVRFRYWDGSTWLDGWDTPDLPVGIEVSLGLEPLPAEMTSDEYPFELYRRVIYLPNHGPARTAAATTEEGM